MSYRLDYRCDKTRQQPRGIVFATALQKLRYQAGITQEVLAAETGLCINSITKLENGHTVPSYDNAVRIADVLGHHLMRVVSLDEFRAKEAV